MLAASLVIGVAWVFSGWFHAVCEFRRGLSGMDSMIWLGDGRLNLTRQITNDRAPPPEVGLHIELVRPPSWRWWFAGATLTHPTYQFLTLPLWMPFLVFSLPALRMWLPRLFAKGGHCRECGYNLAGLATGRCPECGASFNSANASPHPRP